MSKKMQVYFFRWLWRRLFTSLSKIDIELEG